MLESQSTSVKRRFRPVKVKITKKVYDDLLVMHTLALSEGQGSPALEYVLRAVEEGQEAKPEPETLDGMKFRDCLDLLQGLGVRDKVILPNHSSSGASIGRFAKALASLEVTAEDLEKMSEQMLRWKHPCALEKFTAILPSMVTEARAKPDKATWKPSTWEVIDGTRDDGPDTEF